MNHDSELAKDILLKLHGIYGSKYPAIDPVSFEIIYLGTRKQLMSAIRLLEISNIDYMVDWSENDDIINTYVLIIKVGVMTLKSQ
ncbi:MAG: hypothetical protein VR67_07505 [Peptococcaceae bacterium BRH_c8a]|nr:MAG: hypothetical protein VR67_07505 [Peptococcaceae bacterium BRH_c8a]